MIEKSRSGRASGAFNFLLLHPLDKKAVSADMRNCYIRMTSPVGSLVLAPRRNGAADTTMGATAIANKDAVSASLSLTYPSALSATNHTLVCEYVLVLSSEADGPLRRGSTLAPLQNPESGYSPANVDARLRYASTDLTLMVPSHCTLCVRRLGTRTLPGIARSLARFRWRPRKHASRSYLWSRAPRSLHLRRSSILGTLSLCSQSVQCSTV
jgi:hypothetical protein